MKFQKELIEATRIVAMAHEASFVTAILAPAHRLHTLCEHKGWIEETYNRLAVAWGNIEQAMNVAGVVGTQAELEM